MTISPVFHDLYALDDGGMPNIGAVVHAGRPWAGVILKATEGVYYPKDPTWFKAYWPVVKDAANARYGVDWFRGAYHYWRGDEDPVKQADFYLGLIDLAGGWSSGDLWPIVDVETAEQPAGLSNQQIIDSVYAYAARIVSCHGRQPVLYAGSYLRDRRITDHMGCQLLWTAAYGSTLPEHLYHDIGWPLSKLLAWQYESTEGYAGPAGYPQSSPIGAGPQDLSALTIANGATPDQQLAWLRDNIGR